MRYYQYLTKQLDLVPDKNKLHQHKADLEKELVKALVDVDKEQAKINREDAKATGDLSWIQRLWRPTLAWVCVFAFMFQFLVIPITNWYCALSGKVVDLPTIRCFNNYFVCIIRINWGQIF